MKDLYNIEINESNLPFSDIKDLLTGILNESINFYNLKDVSELIRYNSVSKDFKSKIKNLSKDKDSLKVIRTGDSHKKIIMNLSISISEEN